MCKVYCILLHHSRIASGTLFITHSSVQMYFKSNGLQAVSDLKATEDILLNVE